MKPTLVLVAMVAAILTFSSCYYSRPSPFIPAGWILKDTGAIPVPISRTELVAGGKCVAKLTFNKEGELTKVETDTKGCSAKQIPVLVNNEPLLHNSDSITWGKGTCTTWGPPPQPVWNICWEDF
jgi:hypothetical protein